MQIKERLPLGTIIKLKQYESDNILHMIIGYKDIKLGQKNSFHYVLVLSPFGLVSDELWYCENTDILKIIYTGYEKN